MTVADGDMSPALTSKLLRGELQRFRESLESIWSSGSLGLVELAYLHVKLLALRHSTMVAPQQLLGSALRIADILASAQIPTTPLGHHFAALALGTLVDLAEVKEIKEEAWKGIEKFMESLDKQRGAVGGGDGDGWHKAIKDLIERRRQARFTVSASSGSDIPPGHGSLQHLAELAVGERSPTNPTTGFNYPTVPHLDMARLQRYGYLGSLVL